jgi:fucose permease
MGLAFFVNGLSNNLVIPIAHKISLVYDLSSAYVNAPIFTSFLVYSLSNFPANYLIDSKGLRVSFLIGSGLYSLGLFCSTLINQNFIFLLFSSVLVSLGQPFIVNCPAKVATFWFTSKNVYLIII